MVAVVVAAPVLVAPAATLGGCKSSKLSRPFARWGDPASYALVGGGDFETNSWRLNNGAQRVAGSERFAVTGTPGRFSLSLPTGGSAQSPPMCVDAASPSLRFFISGRGSVSVEVIYNGKAIPTALALPAGSWEPSLVMLTDGAIGALSGGSAQVSLRMTAVSGQPRVDDVFIDPWNRT